MENSGSATPANIEPQQSITPQPVMNTGAGPMEPEKKKHSLALRITGAIIGLAVGLAAGYGIFALLRNTPSESTNNANINTNTSNSITNDDTIDDDIVDMGPKEQIVTYEGVTDGMNMSFTFYAKNDIVYKQTSRTVIPYSVLGVNSATEAKALIEPGLENLQNIVGYADEVEYTSDAVIETTSVDYDIISLDELKDLDIWSMMEGNTTSGFVSLSQTAKYLERSGFTRVNE